MLKLKKRTLILVILVLQKIVKSCIEITNKYFFIHACVINLTSLFVAVLS